MYTKDSPARALSALPEHPLRYKLNNEVHARPPVSLTHPQRVSYLALMHEGTTEADELTHLRALADAFAKPLPEADGGHLQMDVGDFRLKWERHNEFSSYAFFCSPRPDEPDARHGALPRVPPGWLEALPGSVMVATHIELQSTSAVAPKSVMDGITFLKTVKQNPTYKFTPVIMLTTESEESKKREGQAAGARAWVVKPFQPEQLVNAVQRLCLP